MPFFRAGVMASSTRPVAELLGWHDIGGHPRFPGTREWVAPSAPLSPRAGASGNETRVPSVRNRESKIVCRPFVDPVWVTDTAKRLGLECTVRPRARPKKQSYACPVYLYSQCFPDLIHPIWWLSPF